LTAWKSLVLSAVANQSKFMADQLLERIYEIGNRMYEALQAGDTDAFYEQVHQRGELLNELSESPAPVEATPEWEQLAAALAEQHQMLDRAIADHERQLTEAMGALQRFKGARTLYGQGSPAAGILRENVRG
jgi:phage shock protein A